MHLKRLNKYISDTGFCSRREADALIEKGRVKINGEVPSLGTKVGEHDKVTVNGQSISAVDENKSDRVYLAYHKPVGITCTTERKVKGNIIDAIGFKQRIFPIGRLDKPSEGLILLTNDGDIVNKILRAENAHNKLYRVTVNKPITSQFLRSMSSGVPILDTVTLPCDIKQVGKCSFDIVLQQGLNRQIRRMCEHLSYEVTKLIRKQIMHISLAGLKPGQYRHLSKSEMLEMNRALSDSVKEHTLSNSKPNESNQALRSSKSKNPNKIVFNRDKNREIHKTRQNKSQNKSSGTDNYGQQQKVKGRLSLNKTKTQKTRRSS